MAFVKTLSKRRFFSLVALVLALGMNSFFGWGFESNTDVSLSPLFTFNFTHFDGSMDSRELIQAGLEFSLGKAGNEVEAYYLAKYDKLEKQIYNSVINEQDEKEKCQKILMLMYENCLSLYDADQTRIDVLLEEGRYNCVSSCILYAALCKRCGISVKAQRTKDHCFCKVYLSSGEFDVETTNPYGFDPGTKQQVTDSRYAVVEKKKYSGRREICDRELAGLIAKNLSSIYNDYEVFDLAVGQAVTRMNFLTGLAIDDDSRYDFDAVCTNYVGYLQEKQEFYDAFLWLCKVVEEFGLSKTLLVTFENTLYNCCVFFTNNDDFDEAEIIFDSYSDYLSGGVKTKIQKMLFVTRAQSEVDSLSGMEAIEFVREKITEAKGISGLYDKEVKAQFDNWLEYYWYDIISSKFNAGLYMDAYELSLDALKDVPGSSSLKSIGKQTLYNHDVEIHNKFAELANAKDYEGANEVLLKGLEENPASSILKSDMNSLKPYLK